MANLNADECFSRRVVDQLRGLSHDVRTAHQSGLAGRGVPDEEVLAYASSGGRAVLTMDRWDFTRLHRQSPAHAGIIACSPDPDPAALAMRIDLGIRALADLRGRLIRVNRPA